MIVGSNAKVVILRKDVAENSIDGKLKTLRVDVDEKKSLIGLVVKRLREVEKCQWKL